MLAVPAERVQADTAAEFLRAIDAERPRAVYWCEDLFNLEAFIESELSDLGWKACYEDEPDSLWLGPDQVKGALKQSFPDIDAREGKFQYFSAVFTCQGFSYVTTLEPNCSTEIANQITALAVSRKTDVTASKNISDSEDAALLNAPVAELVGNDVFRKTRGLNKRVLLATKLLGDRIPRHPDGRVTRLAQNSDLCDLNLALVVKAADEQIWLESTLPEHLGRVVVGRPTQFRNANCIRPVLRCPLFRLCPLPL